jgi:hypothetical protein
MNIFCIKINGERAELLSYDRGKGTAVKFRFDGAESAFLGIGSKILRVSDGVAIDDLASLRDGEYTPRLISPSGSYDLPRLVKHGSRITPMECDAEYVRAILERVRMLEAKVKDVEMLIKELNDKINGTVLF